MKRAPTTIPATASELLLPILILIAAMSFARDAGGVEALSQSVVVIGLNAALQKRFLLPPGTSLEPGSVHRAAECDAGVGGKGQDVGVAMSCLMSRDGARDDAAEDRGVLLAQFLGRGPEGDAVRSALRDGYGLSDALTVRCAAPLRTCTTIVGEDRATELVEPSGEVTGGEMDELRTRIGGMAREGGRAGCVCVMGSMPPGCDGGTYADLASRIAGGDTLTLIDSVVGLDPLLETLSGIYGGGSGRGGAVLKLNAAELCRLAGTAKGGGEADGASSSEVREAAAKFAEGHAATAGALTHLCVTDGKWPGYLVGLPGESASASEIRTWRMPSVDLSGEGTLYPIGAGDAVAAGTLAAWQYLRHRSTNGGEGVGFFGVVPPGVGSRLVEKMAEWGDDGVGGEMAIAFAFGIACGSASCLRRENSVFDVEAAAKFFGGMAKPVLL